jgi:hypothetical protein
MERNPRLFVEGSLGICVLEKNMTSGAIIFDIDRIVEREVPTGQEVLMQEMDRLHADVWEVFSSAKGEKLEALLNRRSQ